VAVGDALGEDDGDAALVLGAGDAVVEAGAELDVGLGDPPSVQPPSATARAAAVTTPTVLMVRDGPM
jgi:hypothetical protein